MAHEKLRPKYLFDAEKIEKQKQLTPECFEDGKINFETLRQNLGDWTQNEEDPELEHFGLFWPGKRDARKVAALPPEGTLEPVFGDGLKADGTPDKDGTNDSKNIFIEGENLEVLKLLQKSYANKIKMIYIDPPYNTGNDFVYDDDFTEPLQEYLRRTGQIDEEGKSLTTNKKSDGRFHSKWLSMMYPRLRLARNLLREDGVIFVSIDDNEVHNLRAIMNEIFGEENFISEIVWKRKTGSGTQIEKVFSEHEYILSYVKNNTKGEKWRIINESDGNFKNPDNDTRGSWESCAITAPSKNRNENQLYKIEVTFNSVTAYNTDLSEALDQFIYGKHFVVFRKVDADTQNMESYDEKNNYAEFVRRWAYIPSSMKNVFNENRVYLNNSNLPRYKKFEYEYDGKALRSIYYDEFSTQQGSEELRKLFDGKDYFEYPKPVELLRTLINAVVKEKDIVLDFFAGSASTAEAVLRSSISDLKFICVQIPLEIDDKNQAVRDGYKTISELSKERVRKICNKKEIKDTKFDCGFKSFKLQYSNYKEWNNYTGVSLNDLENKLALFNENPLKEDYKKNGLLTEITLLEGYTLCHNSTILDRINTNSIKKITDDYSKHAILVCLDDKIKKDTIMNLELGDDDVFICLDSAISSEDKLRLSDKGLIKTI